MSGKRCRLNEDNMSELCRLLKTDFLFFLITGTEKTKQLLSLEEDFLRFSKKGVSSTPELSSASHIHAYKCARKSSFSSVVAVL